jgi:hypothetical protein
MPSAQVEIDAVEHGVVAAADGERHAEITRLKHGRVAHARALGRRDGTGRPTGEAVPSGSVTGPSSALLVLAGIVVRLLTSVLCFC